MAKKRFKLTKQRRQHLTTRLRRVGLPLLWLAIGVSLGLVGRTAFTKPVMSANLVWAADSTVQLPNDLKQFLDHQNTCQAYRGPDSPTGVALWGVYQVADKRLAKVAYGCSIDLKLYIMAIKQNQTWSFIPPTDYFASVDAISGNSYLPKCEVLTKYHITKTMEAFCVEADGHGRANEL